MFIYSRVASKAQITELTKKTDLILNDVGDKVTEADESRINNSSILAKTK